MYVLWRMYTSINKAYKGRQQRTWHDCMAYLMELVLAKHPQLFADAVLLKDGGHVCDVNARSEKLPAQLVGHWGLVLLTVGDLDG